VSNDIVKKINAVPVIDAGHYAHVGRYAGAVGGVNRMHIWADQNPTDFYTKLLPKLISRTTQLEVSGSVTLDDAITRLEAQGDIVDAEWTEAAPEQDYDL
jgi:hypothetical protein